MNWQAFLQDDKGAPSNSRLNLTIVTVGLLLLSYIMVILGRPEVGAVVAVLGTIVTAAFGIGKVSQDSVTKKQMETSDPAPKPPDTSSKPASKE